MRTIILKDGREFLVGTAKQARAAAHQYIRDSLWAFNADFICKFAFPDVTRLEGTIGAIKKMQETLCEDCNEIVYKLIGGTQTAFRKFADEAIKADGMEHFLSGYYDGEEQASDDIEGLPRGLLAYRIG